MRNDVGQIVNLLKVEDIQKKINANVSKDGQYVIESYKFTDATDDTPYILTVSYFDLNEDRAYNVGFVGDYFEEVANAFYAKENVVDGNFDIVITNDSIARSVNWVFSLLEDQGASYCPPGWFVRCSPTNCKAGSCVPMWSGGSAMCSPCEPLKEELNSSCAASDGPFWKAVSAIASILNLFFN